MKRIFDLVLALILFLPAILIVAVAAFAVALESPGYPLFLQKRVGKGRRPFTLLKLRTMRKGTASVASHVVCASAITPLGSWLRRTKIDELPQIWSVIVGDMSFVGPRPCLPSQGDLITEREGRGVFSVRPGITGLAQLAGVDMSTPDKLAQLDADYVANRTFIGDVTIIVRTVLGQGCGDAARN